MHSFGLRPLFLSHLPVARAELVRFLIDWKQRLGPPILPPLEMIIPSPAGKVDGVDNFG